MNVTPFSKNKDLQVQFIEFSKTQLFDYIVKSLENKYNEIIGGNEGAYKSLSTGEKYAASLSAHEIIKTFLLIGKQDDNGIEDAPEHFSLYKSPLNEDKKVIKNKK